MVGKAARVAWLGLDLGCRVSEHEPEPPGRAPPHQTTPVSEPGFEFTASWRPCALEPSAGDALAECSDIPLPLDPADPSGPTLSLAVKRLPATAPRTGMLWLLDGGPGASALDDFVDLAQAFPTDRPDLDIYAVDHRGVGGSGRLSCPEQEAADSEGGSVITDAEWPDCIERLIVDWGDDLAFVNTTNSALDLATLIDGLRAPDDEVFIWGGSYGTYLAQRHLQLRPDQPTAVVIDSIAPPGLDLSNYDRGYDAVGRQLLALCAGQDSCREHLGTDPVALTAAVVASFDAGHCSELGVDAAFIRGMLAGLLGSAPVRDLMPAVVHRLDRCTLDDMNAVVNLYNAVFGAGFPTGNTGAGRSEALFVHIAASELCEGLCNDPAALEDAQQGLLFSPGLSLGVAQLAPVWPVYSPDAYDGAHASYTGPLLMLQGGLDPATPSTFAEPVRDHYDGPHQTWAFFPQGAHLNSASSRLVDGSICAYELALALFDQPSEAPDLGCIDDVVPIDFDGTPAMNLALFGDTDAWGDP